MIRRLWRALGRRGRDEKGQAAFEFLIVLPFLFVVIFLSVEGAYILKTWNDLELASREGAREAVVRTAGSTVVSDTRAKAQNLNASFTGSSPSVTVTVSGPPASCTGSDPSTQAVGCDVLVSVSGTYTYRSPLVAFVNWLAGGSLPNTMTLTGRTHMRLEEQTS